MDRQHIENLFRRLKGEQISIKSISGGVYEGRITDVTNDYVCLGETGGTGQVFVFFIAIESMLVSDAGE